MIQRRRDVAARWGIDTAATASLVSTARVKSGVSTLPTPKPATDAMAPATTEPEKSNASNIRVSRRR